MKRVFAIDVLQCEHCGGPMRTYPRFIRLRPRENPGLPRPSQPSPASSTRCSAVRSLGDGKWQVSEDGGIQPKWRTDKEIIFRFQGTWPAADVNASGNAFQAGTPKALFTIAAFSGWDVTSDGKRFLVLMSSTPQASETPLPWS